MDKEWNSEKGMFEITEYKNIDGKDQIVKVPVPILNRADAERKYMKSYQLKLDKESDPNCVNFKSYYRPAFTYKALNRLIQGSAADMTKKGYG